MHLTVTRGRMSPFYFHVFSNLVCVMEDGREEKNTPEKSQR